jgi:hypothetical protein
MKRVFSARAKKKWYYFPISGLADASIMTSLQTSGPEKYSWDGKSAVANINVSNANLDNCAAVSKMQLVGVPCDEKQNFMCEKGSAKITTISPLKAEY